MPEITTSQLATRRDTLKRGLAAAGLLAFVPDWATPALAQGEVDVPFTDIPATFNPNNATTARSHARYSEDRRAVHTERPVLHHPAHEQAGSRCGHLQAEVHRHGEQAGRVHAGRSAGDEVRRVARRLRVLRQQPASHAGFVFVRSLHGRALKRCPEASGRQSQGSRSGLLRRPTTDRRTLSSGRRRSRSSSSSGAASRWRTR